MIFIPLSLHEASQLKRVNFFLYFLIGRLFPHYSNRAEDFSTQLILEQAVSGWPDLCDQ